MPTRFASKLGTCRPSQATKLLLPGSAASVSPPLLNMLQNSIKTSHNPADLIALSTDMVG